MEQLHHIPGSRVRAIAIGGIQFLGWGTPEFQMANLYDLIAAIGYGLSGKRLPDAQRYPRPERPVEQQLIAPTLADLDIGGFMSRFTN